MTWKLTGKTRFRSSRPWIREVLILQVEETRREYDYPAQQAFIARRWRDATTEDITRKEPPND